MTIRNFVPTIALLALCQSGFAQTTTVVTRYDGTANPAKAGYTLGVIRPEGEVWILFQNTSFPEYEVGRLAYLPLSKSTSLLLGGYLAYQPAGNQVYALPWGMLNQKMGSKVRLHAELAYYLPLNGGQAVLWSNECSANCQLVKGLEGGMVATFWWPTGEKLGYGIGPKVSADLSHGFNLSLRALLWGKKDPQYRMVLARSF